MPQSTKLLIHVFANTPGLGLVLAQATLITKPDILNEFVNGFNSLDELVTFVNVGKGKELTDSKINGTWHGNFALT